VARRPVTFFASPKKVTKKRRPQVQPKPRDFWAKNGKEKNSPSAQTVFLSDPFLSKSSGRKKRGIQKQPQRQKQLQKQLQKQPQRQKQLRHG